MVVGTQGTVQGEGVAEWEAACVPSTQHCSSLFSPQQNGKSVQFFFQLTNSLWIDAAGNKHPAEIINKHFIPNLWIFGPF